MIKQIHVHKIQRNSIGLEILSIFTEPLSQIYNMHNIKHN